jgi:hypothetical protein
MNSKRLYFIFLGTICLLVIGLIAGAYGTNSLLTGKANTLLGLKAKSTALDKQQQSLIKAKRDIASYADLEKITKSVVPQEKNQAAAVREIVNIAANRKITLTSFSFPGSTLGNGVVVPGGAATATPSGGAGSKSGTLSQLTPVKNIPGVYQFIITVQNDSTHEISYDQFVSFLSDLEHNRHTAQVSTISLTPDTRDRNSIQFNLSLVEYVKP